MADSIETDGALYTESRGIDCPVSQELNENRVTLRHGETFTAYGVEKIEREDGRWWAEFRLGPFETRTEALDEILGFEFVER